MITNTLVAEKFKPRLNYKRKKTPSTKKNQWRRTRLGRGSIIVIGLVGDEMSGGAAVAVSRDFPNAEQLYKRVLAMLPWLPEYYQGEKPLNVDIVKDRYHKMYYRNKTKTRQGRGAMSPEHYLHDERLRASVPAVERLYKRGRIITREELEAVCQ